LRNRHVARAIADQGWAEFHRQLAYKCRWYGSELVVAPRFFPSTKTCSGCEAVNATLRLDVRSFNCATCGLELDRDLNAARNLARLGEAGAPTRAVGELVAASSAETQNACGEGSAGWIATNPVKLPSAKQERTGIYVQMPIR
jgi:transposase